MPNDLIDAVIERLDADIAVVEAFGDTKFYADFVPQVDLPYCVIYELGETYGYMTAAEGNQRNFTAPGQMMFSIYAAGRYESRTLGFVVANSLNDAPLDWPGFQLMEFRLINSRFNPIPATGPGVPTVFNRAFIFEYEYSGSL